jgi:signal transduction histidine kinase
MNRLNLKALRGPPGSWPDRNPDVGWVLIAAAIGGATLASVWPKHEPALGVLAAVAGTLACVSLAWRRSRPLAVAVFTGTVAMFSPMAVAATILAVVNAAVSCSLATYVLLVAYVVVVAAAHVAFFLEHAGFLSDQLPAVWVLLPVTVLGLVARARRSRSESEQQRRVEQARAAERRRIAREMHDVLAHRISIVRVHVGALEVHPDAPTEDIATAAGVIRASAHAALAELREVINLLRNHADRGDDPDGVVLMGVVGVVNGEHLRSLFADR